MPGITYDGGYADYMIAPAEALALIPDGLSAVESGPMMCAGITTFNSLRHSEDDASHGASFHLTLPTTIERP